MAGVASSNVRAITQRQVELLRPGGRLWDDKLRGFCVRCQGQAKTFGLQVRVAGKQRWLTIGKWGVLTPEEARQRARALLGRLAAGDDIAGHRERLKAQPTVDELADLFVAQHVRPKLKPGTAAEYKRLLESCIKTVSQTEMRGRDSRGRPSRKPSRHPRLGTLRVDGVTTADVMRFHNGLSAVPYEANRALAVLSRLMSFAEVQGYRAPGSNPCRGVPRFKEQRRERFLNLDDFAVLAEVLDSLEVSNRMSPFIIGAIRLLILTGARREEIRTLRWSYIDRERGLAFLPDSKTGRKTVHLSPAALRLLSHLPRMASNPYVFPGGRSDHSERGKSAARPLRDLQGPWEQIRALAGFPELRIHDLRHSYASLLAASGTPLLVIGKLLGHRHTATTARYAHLADDPLRIANAEAGERLASRLALTGSSRRLLATRVDE